MTLSHPQADGITQRARTSSSPLRLLVLVLLTAAAFGGFAAQAALAADPTVTLTVVPPTTPGGPATLHATVTSTRTFPSGSIGFADADKPADAPYIVPLIPVTASGTFSSYADLSTAGFEARPWSLQAVYVPNIDAYPLLKTSSPVVALNLGTGTTPLPTQVSLTTTATDVDPLTPGLDVYTTPNLELTATVSELGGSGTPAGTVAFTDTSSGTSLAAAVPLVGGVAHLTVPNLGVGTHTFIASYTSSSPSDLASASAVLRVAVRAAVDSSVITHTVVTVSPSPIAAGDLATVTATITQDTPDGTVPATRGNVIFSAQKTGGLLVNTASIPLGTAPTGYHAEANQAIVQIPGLPEGDFTIVASYFGNLYGFQNSAKNTTLTVLPQRIPSFLSYRGNATAEFGHPTTLAATVSDHGGNPLAGRSVTFTLGAQTCKAQTDSNGLASCSIDAVSAHPADTSVNVDLPQDLQTQPANADFDFQVTPEATSISAIAQPGPGTTLLTATLSADTGALLDGQPVTLTLGTSCTATTDAGIASCTVPTITGPASATLTANFAGSTDYLPISSTTTVPLVLPTSLTYTGAAGSAFNSTPTLSATLVDGNGTRLPGRSLTFTIGTQSCSATTDAAGIATCAPLTITQDAGPYTVAVQYAGDAFTRASAASAPFTVTLAPTTLTAAVPTPGAPSTTLTATLKASATGLPLAGQPVTLTLGTSAPCTTTTSASGVASCSVPTPSGTSATFTATFLGDADYAASRDSKNVVLLKPTVLSYTGPASGDYHDPLLLTGKLTDASGAGIAGQPVSFTIGSQTCPTTTLAGGYAVCPLLTLTQPAALTTVTMSYAGNTTYALQSNSSPFTIAREDVTLLALGSDGVINDTTIALSGLLLEDSLFPVPGKTVTLSLGASSCHGVTNDLGVATCTVPRAAALGPTTFSGTFSQDAYYLAASFSRTVIVCSFASGGSFVIGDRDDSGSVNFWGSQWSKRNHLSHGDAPSSFKGWTRGSFTPSWNGTWSTDPGSSSPPPAGQLPSYMAVIQTGTTSKSGSRILGDTVNVVVVKTDAGYAPNAGHDGTGTIVATVR